MKSIMVNSSDIRLVNEFQESGRVFVHLFDGTTIRRIMTSAEVRNIQRIRRHEGMKAFHAAVAELINRKYNEPQKNSHTTMSAHDERYFELVNKKRITGSVSADEEDELKALESYDEER